MKKEYYQSIFLFSAIWIAVVFADRWLIGVTYAHTVHDHEAAWFSWALNWLSHRPELAWYTPAPSARIINGLAAHFINLDYTERPIEQLERIGILVQFLFVVVSAVWFSWAAKILKIKALSQLFIVIGSCCIPTILIFSGHRGFYFELGLLGVPFGLTLAAVLGGSDKAFRVSGIACGFFIANYYPSIVILLSFLVTLGWARYRTVGWPGRQLLTLPLERSEWTLVLLVGTVFVAWVTGAFFFELAPGVTWRWVLIAIFLTSGFAFVCVYLMLIYVRWIKGFFKFSIWFLITFVSSNLILLPWYPFGLFLAKKQSVAVESSLIYLISSFGSYPWFYVLWLNWISLLIVFLYVKFRKFRDVKDRNQLLDATVFSILGTLGIMLIGGATVTGGSIPGLAERGMIGAIPTLSVGWFVIFRTIGYRWRPMYWGVLVVLIVVVVNNYYREYSFRVFQENARGLAFDTAIDIFFADNPDGRLVCIADEFSSRYCATAYYYNRWRTVESAKRLPTRHLFDGQLVSLNAKMEDRVGNWDDSLETIENVLFPRPDYANYVLGNPDLKKVWRGSNSNLEDWGAWHWNAHGRKEHRTISPFHQLRGPLLVITKGGFFRDQLIELLSGKGLKFVAIWRWVEFDQMDDSVQEAVPGTSFLMVGDDVLQCPAPTIDGVRHVSTKCRPFLPPFRMDGYIHP